MEAILALQEHLQALGMSIDVVLASFFGFMSLMGAGYLIGLHINKDDQDAKNQFDWEN